MTTDENLNLMEDRLKKAFNVISILRSSPNRITPRSMLAIKRILSEIEATASQIDDELYHKNSLEKYLLKYGGAAS